VQYRFRKTSTKTSKLMCADRSSAPTLICLLPPGALHHISCHATRNIISHSHLIDTASTIPLLPWSAARPHTWRQPVFLDNPRAITSNSSHFSDVVCTTTSRRHAHYDTLLHGVSSSRIHLHDYPTYSYFQWYQSPLIMHLIVRGISFTVSFLFEHEYSSTLD